MGGGMFYICSAPNTKTENRRTRSDGRTFGRVRGIFPILAAAWVVVGSGQAHADDRAAAGAWGEVGKGNNVSIGGYVDFAPQSSLYEDGLRLRLHTSYDRYYYDDFDATRITGELYEFDFLGGGTVNVGKAQFTALAGPAIVAETISPVPVPDDSRTSIGVRFSLDSRFKLRERTALRLSGHYRTTRQDYAVSGNLLFPLTDKLIIGPSAQLKGNEDYQEFKLGAVISGVKIADVDLTLSGGVSFQDGEESSFFGLSSWIGF